MIKILQTDLPPFLEEQFAKMVIPGDGYGFAISHGSANERTCVAFGRLEHGGIAVRTRGDEYLVDVQKRISSAEFDSLAKTMTCEFKKSGMIFAEDMLDGESYLVMWSDSHEVTRLVLANPRDLDNPAIREFAEKLDNLMRRV